MSAILLSLCTLLCPGLTDSCQGISQYVANTWDSDWKLVNFVRPNWEDFVQCPAVIICPEYPIIFCGVLHHTSSSFPSLPPPPSPLSLMPPGYPPYHCRTSLTGWWQRSSSREATRQRYPGTERQGQRMSWSVLCWERGGGGGYFFCLGITI